MPSAYAERPKPALREDIGGLMAQLASRPQVNPGRRKLSGPERAATLSEIQKRYLTHCRRNSLTWSMVSRAFSLTNCPRWFGSRMNDVDPGCPRPADRSQAPVGPGVRPVESR